MPSSATFRPWTQCFGDALDKHTLPCRVVHHRLVTRGSRLHRGAEPSERIGKQYLADRSQQRVGRVPSFVHRMPSVAVERDESVEFTLEEGRGADDYESSAHSVGVVCRERQGMRTPATTSAHVHNLECEIVEKFRRVLGDDGDPASGKPTRLSIAWSVEDDQARVQTVVDPLISVPRGSVIPACPETRTPGDHRRDRTRATRARGYLGASSGRHSSGEYDAARSARRRRNSTCWRRARGALAGRV